MKKIAMLLTLFPFLALADVAPMSREEWARIHQWPFYFFTQPSPAGYALASLTGALLSIFVIALDRAGRGKRWHDLVALTPMQFVLITILILGATLCGEWAFRPFSTLLSVKEESYEEYLFYEKHCRRCGTRLAYCQGRYCPKCHPRQDNSMMPALINKDKYHWRKDDSFDLN